MIIMFSYSLKYIVNAGISISSVLATLIPDLSILGNNNGLLTIVMLPQTLSHQIISDWNEFLAGFPLRFYISN